MYREHILYIQHILGREHILGRGHILENTLYTFYTGTWAKRADMAPKLLLLAASCVSDVCVCACVCVCVRVFVCVCVCECLSVYI